MKAVSAKIDITLDRPRYTLPGAYTGHPEALLLDPPNVSSSRSTRAAWKFSNDGAHRMVFVTYDLNLPDRPQPRFCENAWKKEYGIPPAYLVLLARTTTRCLCRPTPTYYYYGAWLADKIYAGIRSDREERGRPGGSAFRIRPRRHRLRCTGATFADGR